MEKQEFEATLMASAKLYNAALFIAEDEEGVMTVVKGEVGNLIDLVVEVMTSDENIRRTIVNAMMQFIATDKVNGPQVEGVVRVLLSCIDSSNTNIDKK